MFNVHCSLFTLRIDITVAQEFRHILIGLNNWFHLKLKPNEQNLLWAVLYSMFFLLLQFVTFLYLCYDRCTGPLEKLETFVRAMIEENLLGNSRKPLKISKYSIISITSQRCISLHIFAFCLAPQGAQGWTFLNFYSFARTEFDFCGRKWSFYNKVNFGASFLLVVRFGHRQITHDQGGSRNMLWIVENI